MAQESQDKAIVKNESFKQNGIKLKESPKIYIVSESFPLDKSDYIILTKIRSVWSFWIHSILMCAITLFFIVAGKYMYILTSKQAPDIKNWELIAIGIALIFALILKAISHFCPDEKKKLIKKLNEHFETSKKQIGVLNNNEKR